LKKKLNKVTEFAVAGIQDKKGEDVVIIDLEKIGSAVADNFVICHGNSDTQVNAIAESVEDAVTKAFPNLSLRKEGAQSAEWVLLDFGDVIVHVFKKSIRDFYELEKLWGDAEIINIE
jgi:ribosome-associated protein